MNQRKIYRVPPGRVVGLKDLRARMATANDLAYHLELTSDADDFREVMEALNEAYWLAAALAAQTSRTGCPEHPQGPVDPEAPEGWGRCLLCNSRRRSGLVRQRDGARLGWTGATSGLNRPQRSLEAARQPSSPDSARWREPEGMHEAQFAYDSPILARRRERADPTHAAALARARRQKAEGCKEQTDS
ncbi:hypothetical protein ABZ682_22700 [Streptomyces griseoviridis]|uniref:hypothetical protein n=1 Tax=Streptomyces griseoviridis TaxID=45398 RepID=UPI0033C550E2